MSSSILDHFRESLAKLSARKRPRLLAIGDIHGCYDDFCRLWERVAFDPERDFAVFLGDYTDRGPKSREVMEWVLTHKKDSRMVFLMGNHELMLQAAFTDDAMMDLWLSNGGQRTLDSLGVGAELLLYDWLTLLKDMPLYYEVKQEDGGFIFCHAGLDPEKPMEEQDSEKLLWDRSFAAYGHSHGPTVVLGHTPVRFIEKGRTTPIFRREAKVILADTGSYFTDGRISAIDVLTGDFVQS